MSDIKAQINELLEREVDRKQFLQYSLAVFLAAFGVTGLIQALLSSDTRISKNKQHSNGYNSARYNR